MSSSTLNSSCEQPSNFLRSLAANSRVPGRGDSDLTIITCGHKDETFDKKLDCHNNFYLLEVSEAGMVTSVRVNKPCHEKTVFVGVRPGKTQTGLLSISS